MVKDLSREGAREGTRKLMLGGSAVAAALFVGLFALFAVPDLFGTTDYLGRPSTGADKGTAATTVGKACRRSAKPRAPLPKTTGTEDESGGRARKIKQSPQPVSLTQEQRDKLRAIFSTAGGPKMDRTNFEMMIGTAVPDKPNWPTGRQKPHRY